MVPFTQQLREEYKLTPDELMSIQFYFSNTFVLRKGEQSDKRQTEDGELTLIKDSKIEEIVVKALTPCVIKKVVDGNRVTISFESDGNKHLVFGSIRNKDGYYTLTALDWSNGRGKLNYGEQMYLSSQGSRDVFLALKIKSLHKLNVDRKVARGIKL